MNEQEEFEFRARAEAENQAGGSSPSLKGFAKNAMEDYGSNARGAAEMASYAFPPLAATQGAMGTNIYDPKRLSALGKGMLQGVKQIPKNTAQEIMHPVDSMYNKPLSTVLDLAGVAGGAMDLANLARGPLRSAAMKTLPGMGKSLAGIPERATEMAISKPEIFNTAPLADEAVDKAVGQPIINAIQNAKKSVQALYSKAYRKYAGMEGPMQEIVDTPIAQKLNVEKTKIPMESGFTTKPQTQFGQMQVESDNPLGGKVKDWVTTQAQGSVYDKPKTIMAESSKMTPGDLTTVPRTTHSYDELLINKNFAKLAFEKGDKDALAHLYKQYVSPTADISALGISDKERIQILTRLKREVQQQASFNKAPITLKPIDGAKDAAFKQMGSELDALREKLPNGKKLAAVDDGWKAIHDIYDTVQKDLMNPGKTKDLAMRLLKGDNSWLTTGRMNTKVNAIRRAELISGTKILEPAMEELTRQVFKEWSGKGFTAQSLRAIGGMGGMGTALFEAGSKNPLAAAAAATGAGASMAASSPRVWRGGIRTAAALGKGAKVASSAMRGIPEAALLSAFNRKRSSDDGQNP